MKTIHRWTDQDHRFVREHYREENRDHLTLEALAAALDTTPLAVRGEVIKLRLCKTTRRWSDKDLAFLNDYVGIMSDEQLARHFDRTPNAIHLALVRRLTGINHKTNIYTARSLARLFGIGCSKTIVAWHSKDFLKGKRSPVHCGKTFMWGFLYEDIVKCLRRRPWLVSIDRMEESYFRSIVQEQWDKNPWYSCREAAPLLGIKDHNAVQRYIRSGWLPAVRKPSGGTWEWIIRKRAIDAFLEDDPRSEHRRKAFDKSRRNQRRKFLTRRTYWAKKMATAVMRGRGVRVNRCPIGRQVCHLVCHFRNEDKCHYQGPIGRTLSRAKREKKGGNAENKRPFC